VILPATVVSLLAVIVPPFVLPILILVVEPDAPPVPRLRVLVVPDAVAPVARFIVVASPPTLIVRALLGNKSKLVLVVSIDVVTTGLAIVGDELNTTDPDPVSSVNIADNDKLVPAVKNVIALATSPVTPVEIGTVTLMSAVPSNA
jgi:hypothetical protein